MQQPLLSASWGGEAWGMGKKTKPTAKPQQKENRQKQSPLTRQESCPQGVYHSMQMKTS